MKYSIKIAGNIFLLNGLEAMLTSQGYEWVHPLTKKRALEYYLMINVDSKKLDWNGREYKTVINATEAFDLFGKPQNEEVKLNDTYTAVVSKDGVDVDGVVISFKWLSEEKVK